MQIQSVPITSVKPYEKNPRSNDNTVDAVAKSTKEFGWQQSIVVDSEMVGTPASAAICAASTGLQEEKTQMDDDRRNGQSPRFMQRFPAFSF